MKSTATKMVLLIVAIFIVFVLLPAMGGFISNIGILRAIGGIIIVYIVYTLLKSTFM